jgi:cytoskeletal protein RodZ
VHSYCSRFGLLFFILLFLSFLSLSSLPVWRENRLLFLAERSAATPNSTLTTNNNNISSSSSSNTLHAAPRRTLNSTTNSSTSSSSSSSSSSGGLYSYGAYFAAVALSDVLLVRVAPPLLFALATYPLAGLSTQGGSPRLLVLAVILVLADVASALAAMGVVSDCIDIILMLY